MVSASFTITALLTLFAVPALGAAVPQENSGDLYYPPPFWPPLHPTVPSPPPPTPTWPTFPEPGPHHHHGLRRRSCTLFTCADQDQQGHELKTQGGDVTLGTLTCLYHDNHLFDWPWAKPVCTYDHVRPSFVRIQFHGVDRLACGIQFGNLTSDKDNLACPDAVRGCLPGEQPTAA